MSSSLTVPASIAMSDASKNVAGNVPRLILFAMLASVSAALPQRANRGSRIANLPYAC
jgi:hypothetical protein